MEKKRCPWCLGNPDYQKYHDAEWGKPLKKSQRLFELLILEGAQAGLSWLTILKRREGYRRAFNGFDPERIARYTAKDVARLLADPGIIRNRRKIESTIENARAFLRIEENVSFSTWLWNWVDGKPIINHFKTMRQIPASTGLSERISAALKKQGFSFVGPTIVYAYMQSAGLVNDHLLSCFRHPENTGPER
ncbi:MAG: DNA-3-methyladenine glycosylase I [Spirochaetaceae bacterium]|jgi:DNA-3-methyladenine glycosylase I|nr:DNA-3-methyladenine glycosylase I [Spirochaetaceae bacterium]